LSDLKNTCLTFVKDIIISSTYIAIKDIIERPNSPSITSNYPHILANRYPH